MDSIDEDSSEIISPLREVITPLAWPNNTFSRPYNPQVTGESVGSFWCSPSTRIPHFGLPSPSNSLSFESKNQGLSSILSTLSRSPSKENLHVALSMKSPCSISYTLDVAMISPLWNASKSAEPSNGSLQSISPSFKQDMCNPDVTTTTSSILRMDSIRSEHWAFHIKSPSPFHFRNAPSQPPAITESSSKSKALTGWPKSRIIQAA